MVDRARPLREARIDLAVASRNVEVLANDGALLVDVAGDAYGHGAIAIAVVALDAGAAAVRVRDERERAVLVDAGIDSALIRFDPVAPDATAAVFGVASAAGVAPVMRVSARVISVKSIDAGEPVSYGYTWRAERRSTLALVPLGYADGVMRSASNRGRVWLAGSMRPIVGRVAMNVMVLDLGDDRIDLGEEAVLFGDPAIGAGANQWAEMLSADRAAALSAIEVTAGIGATVSRMYVG